MTTDLQVKIVELRRLAKEAHDNPELMTMLACQNHAAGIAPALCVALEATESERDAARAENERLRAACEDAIVGLRMTPCGCSPGGGFVCAPCYGLRAIRAVLAKEDSGL